MDFEITPQPSDQEREAIEAALLQEEKRTSAWADALLPQRSYEPDPYPLGPPER